MGSIAVEESGMLPRSGNSPSLKILIVGGGLGGLTASISLRQQGHSVEVFDQSRFANEIGAAICTTPNCLSVLLKIGVNPRDSGATPLTVTRFLSSQNQLLSESKWADQAHQWQKPWLQAHRAHLHAQLRNAATSEKGEGKPVVLHTSSRVVKVDPHSATITTNDGRQWTGDVVLGADGVHSKTRHALAPKIPEAYKTPHSAFRFLLDRQTVLDDPELPDLGAIVGAMDMWYGPDRKIVMYQTDHNKLLNFVCVHPASLSDAKEGYNEAANKETMLEVYKDFDPSLVKLLSRADPASLKVWPMYDIDQLPIFINDRFAVLGDAAHPFTPHLAQGGAQAIEDGVSLGIMLSRGVTREEVPERLELYQKARYQRASTIQQYSRIVGKDGEAKDSDEAPRFNIHDYFAYGFSHDEIDASTQILREYLWRKEQYRWRQPNVFGPIPGPRQILGLPNTPSQHDAIVEGATMRFKTSGTLIRNLFPNANFSFENRNTVVEVAWVVESFKNLAWLGGGGYELLSFHIYGVQFKKPDGSVVKGTYCPVTFENFADPISSGREELGYPKVYSDIVLDSNKDSHTATLSWRGRQWATFKWSDLQSKYDEAQHGDDDSPGLLVHKYIPSTPPSNNPDADYTVHISPSTSHKPERVSSRRCPASDTSFSISDLGPGKLPTLHHIVQRLAEIPVYEMMDGRVEVSRGMDNLSGAVKIS